jgi:cobyrinic acid a,c-diamide synthase
MAHILVSAAHKSSGKTTVTLGLCAALRKRGLSVQAFKKGPDYIDPMWLSHASGRSCYNLDFFTMSPAEIEDLFSTRAAEAEISIVEGNKGLYDGLDLEGRNSNAALANLLHAPVVLVLDARGMTRGIAPLILGYQAFDPDIRIAGVILNQLGGSRHESKLRAVIEHYTDVRVLGAVHHDDSISIEERHLGLVPSPEEPRAAAYVADLATRIGEQVDLDAVLAVAESAGEVKTSLPVLPSATVPKPLRIGVLRDSAFCFYYPDDIEAMEASGAELVYIDALNSSHLPALDGLFIGGGFPETHMQGLEANHTLRHEIRRAIENGLPAYAECGGLMYLARSISWKDTRAEMVGALPGDIIMHETPQGRGYVLLEETGQLPWPEFDGAAQGDPIPCHEFHYSSIINLPDDTVYAYRVLRGTGIDGKHDGIVCKNLVASYSHRRNHRSRLWTDQFLNFAALNQTESIHTA